MVRNWKVLLACALAVAAEAPAQAANVTGGSSLLTQGDANQLESWLGHGAITLNNIFTKQAGSDSNGFHTAADGKGATFVVLQATDTVTGMSALIGGYNPQSWNSSGTYNVTLDTADRTGFVFNLSTLTRYSQRASQPAVYDQGVYQTYNSAGYGPTFGGGHDIYVDGALSSGYSYLWTYTLTGSDSVTTIITGGYYSSFVVSGLEVFTVTPGVPEPGTWVLVAAGVAVTAAARAKRGQHSNGVTPWNARQ
jgi:hypothetical protein